jgi:tetratricopeptide (TPR) repeat protein
MKRASRNITVLIGAVAVLSLGLSPLSAQKVKSKDELSAITAVQVAATPDAKIAAVENVLTKFADTEFKVPLLTIAVQSEEQKNDFAQVVFYGERLLKADPMNAFALVTLASETARHTRENDLDKDEQLTKVDKWAKDGIEAAKIMPKPRADVADADWEGARKDLEAQGYLALGMSDMLRKNPDGAVANYKLSLSITPTPNPGTMVRLAQVYISQGKLDDANFTLDKVISTPDVVPQIKSVAENLKAQLAKRKPAAAAPPSSTPGAAAAPSASPATPPASQQP